MSNFEKISSNASSAEVLTGANLKITVNSGAYEILDILVDSYKNRQEPYNEAVLPQDYKPDSLQLDGEHYGSPRHAMYFWNMCSYMQGGVKTGQAFKRMTDIFNANPEFFDCRLLSQFEPNDVSNKLEDYRLGRQHSVADHWVKNAKIMLEKYDGDPRNIFKGTTCYEDCVGRIKKNGEIGFNGFREKMTSMILYYYMNEGLIPEISFPVPVDFHALRVALATEMITVEPNSFYTYNHVVEDSLRLLFKSYLEKRDVCSLDLTNSIWLLSSNLCNKSLGNYPPSSKGGSDFRGLSTEKLRQSKSWQQSCGKCVVERCCRYYISSEPYYTKGAICPIEKR